MTERQRQRSHSRGFHKRLRRQDRPSDRLRELLSSLGDSLRHLPPSDKNPQALGLPTEHQTLRIATTKYLGALLGGSCFGNPYPPLAVHEIIVHRQSCRRRERFGYSVSSEYRCRR